MIINDRLALFKELQKLDLADFRLLCFLLEKTSAYHGFAYDNLQGETLDDKIQALIRFSEKLEDFGSWGQLQQTISTQTKFKHLDVSFLDIRVAQFRKNSPHRLAELRRLICEAKGQQAFEAWSREKEDFQMAEDQSVYKALLFLFDWFRIGKWLEDFTEFEEHKDTFDSVIEIYFNEVVGLIVFSQALTREKSDLILNSGINNCLNSILIQILKNGELSEVSMIFLRMLVEFQQIPLQDSSFNFTKKLESFPLEEGKCFSKAERELRALHEKKYYWHGHDMHIELKDMPVIWSKHQLLIAPSGGGKTAILTSLYYGQSPPEFFTVYLNEFTKLSQLEICLAEHMLDYLSFKATLLLKVPTETQKYLAYLLIHALDKRELVAKIDRYTHAKAWQNEFSRNPSKEERIRQELLNDISLVCLSNLKTYITEMSDSNKDMPITAWVRGYLECLNALTSPKSIKIRVVLDDDHIPETALQELHEYGSDLRSSINFILVSTNDEINRFLPSWQKLLLDWGQDQLERLFLHRLAKQYGINPAKLIGPEPLEGLRRQIYDPYLSADGYELLRTSLPANPSALGVLWNQIKDAIDCGQQLGRDDIATIITNLTY